MARRKRGGVEYSTVQNAAKTLFANIRFASVDKPVKSIVTTSTIPNEGKTTVAIQLAQAIATSGKRVLLVECDMRRRSIGGVIGAHSQNGIYSVLSGAVPLQSAIIETVQRNMYFLDVEPHIPNPADLIASRRFERMMHEIDDLFDYAVYDTCPVGPFVDGALVAARADATVLVIRENFTNRAAVQDAYSQLEKAGANVVGIAMNFCEQEEHNYYYYSYYYSNGRKSKREAREDNNTTQGFAAAAVSYDQAGGMSSPNGTGSRRAAVVPAVLGSKGSVSGAGASSTGGGTGAGGMNAVSSSSSGGTALPAKKRTARRASKRS